MKKVLKWLLLAVGGMAALMVVGVFVMWVLFFRINIVEQKNDEQTWTSDTGTRSALILYQSSRFSLTQDTVDCMGETLQEEDYDVIANHPRSDLVYEIEDYDVIVLCSPVYGGTVSQPLLDYASCHDFTGRRVIVVVTGKDLTTEAEVRMIEEAVKGADDICGYKTDQANERFKKQFLTMLNQEEKDGNPSFDK